MYNDSGEEPHPLFLSEDTPLFLKDKQTNTLTNINKNQNKKKILVILDH